VVQGIQFYRVNLAPDGVRPFRGLFEFFWRERNMMYSVVTEQLTECSYRGLEVGIGKEVFAGDRGASI
jgi:hypothetical protein